MEKKRDEELERSFGKSYLMPNQEINFVSGRLDFKEAFSQKCFRESSATCMKKATKIKMFLMDVDGVLTDGRIFYVPGPDGKTMETKGFSSTDGIGLRLMRQYGFKTGIITGRISEATQLRARNLGMTHLYQGFLSKLAPFRIIMEEEGIRPEEIAYAGDDWTDIPAMMEAGLACATANARLEVKAVADYITPHYGGDGAVRDICELIMFSQGLKKDILDQVKAAQWPPIRKDGPKIITGND